MFSIPTRKDHDSLLFHVVIARNQAANKNTRD